MQECGSECRFKYGASSKGQGTTVGKEFGALSFLRSVVMYNQWVLWVAGMGLVARVSFVSGTYLQGIMAGLTVSTMQLGRASLMRL